MQGTPAMDIFQGTHAAHEASQHMRRAWTLQQDPPTEYCHFLEKPRINDAKQQRQAQLTLKAPHYGFLKLLGEGVSRTTPTISGSTQYCY